MCTAVASQESPALVSLGTGGAVVVWADARSGEYDIYAQRISAAGQPQWTANGAALSVSAGDQLAITMVSDAAGGAIVAWQMLKSVPIKANIKQQFDIFGNADTWYMTLLYIMTFGTFSGLSAQFGLLMINLYGAGNAEIVSGAGTSAKVLVAGYVVPEAVKFVFLGPLVGAVARFAFSPLTDRMGGARWTLVSGIGLVGSIIYTIGGLVPDTSSAEALQAGFGRFLWGMLAIFLFAGIGNASTFKQMPMIFERRQAGGVIGWTAAIAAFGLMDDSADFEAASTRAMVDESSPIVKVVNQIIVQGVRKRASDIHIESLEHAVRVRYRVDGALTEAIQLPSKMSSPIASRIKVLADLNIVERRRPQDGQFSTEVDGRPIDIRTSVVNTIHGEKVVLRLLDKTRSLIGLEQLGMPDDLVQRYLSVVDVPVGMFLCTGPTGSGKTTSLYATLTEIQDDTRNVVTIEDPVEYEFAGINQMQVHEAGGFTFADGLRGTLRQDPDVILVGEIRDAETARIAMQAALTGHLVLSSLHAVDAVSALHRFVDMGMEPFLVASAVNGIMGQRLLRRICEACKEPATPNPAQAHMVARVLKTSVGNWMQGAGCNQCNHTGYLGRIGVYELLRLNDEIRNLVTERATHAAIHEAAARDGMRTMQEEGFALVNAGITTFEADVPHFSEAL